MRRFIQTLSLLAVASLIPVPAFAAVRDSLKSQLQDSMHLAAQCDYKAAEAKLSQASAALNQSREEATLIGQAKHYVAAKQTDRLPCGGGQR